MKVQKVKKQIKGKAKEWEVEDEWKKKERKL
jgi:hypothetical protein